MSETVQLRPAQDSDLEFLQEVYADSRVGEFSALRLDEVALHTLMSMQFQAQRTQYRQRYPDSRDHVLTLGSVAVGRCWSSRSDDEIRILDIAVLTRFRRRGIASQVLRELGAQAVNVGLRLRLSVWHANDPAIAMYRNLGMNACGEHNGYHELEWSPANHVAFISQEAASHE